MKSSLSARESRYVLITACRNEAKYITGLIDNVAQQTRPPMKWLIVDDGSTDDTYGKAVARTKTLPFIQVIRLSGDRARSFSSQVYAQQRAYDFVRGLEFEFVGFLDADIMLDHDYFNNLIQYIDSDTKIGLAGGAVLDKVEDRLIDSRAGSEKFHVAGGVQFFRRKCFDQIGGYVPVKGGGQDTIADIRAMMCGWKVRTNKDLKVIHLRPDGSVKQNVFNRGLAWGKKFYAIGYHPLFYLAQCLKRIAQRPIVVASVCQLVGFFVAWLQARPRPVEDDFVQFLREQQIARLQQHLKSFPLKIPRKA